MPVSYERMPAWQNFQIWRGRLPHWRADNVTYYATFRHKRDLDDAERSILFSRLLRSQMGKFDISILCVLPGKTELLFKVLSGPTGEPYELSDVLEKCKQKAGKVIIKSSGERWPPFYTESFDRIIRDGEEFETQWLAILVSSVDEGHVTEPEEWDSLFVSERD